MTVTPSSSLTSPLRWTLVTVFLLGIAAGLVLGGPLDRPTLMTLPCAAFAAVGAVVTQRRPRNPVGWVFLSVGTLAGLAGIARACMHQALIDGTPIPWYGVMGAWLNTWVWFPMVTLATVFTVMLFPGGLLSARWRPLLWITTFATAAMTSIIACTPVLNMGNGESPIQLDNPLNPGWSTHTGDLSAGIAGFILLLCTVVALFTATKRFLLSAGVEREQMRWFVFSAAPLVLWGVASGGFFGYSLLDTVVLSALLTLVPLACGIAITRYHLYDIERIISRTTSYVIVTGAVLVTYVAIVALGTRLLPGSSALAVAAATLTAAAAFRPLLRRVQSAVDKRFNRARYDSGRIVELFGDDLRLQADASAVEDSLLEAVRLTLHPAQATLWLRTPS